MQAVDADTVVSLRLTVKTVEYLLQLAGQRPYGEVQHLIPSIQHQVGQQLSQQQLPLTGDGEQSPDKGSDPVSAAAAPTANRATRRAQRK